jgi:hypothetical protein
VTVGNFVDSHATGTTLSHHVVCGAVYDVEYLVFDCLSNEMKMYIDMFGVCVIIVGHN